MNLVVFSHKPVWKNGLAPSGYSTDGGFPFQMSVISELFDATTLVLPLAETPVSEGLIPLSGKNLSIITTSNPPGKDLIRLLLFPLWFLRNLPLIWREIKKADVVHTPVPSDIATSALLIAWLIRKRIFVRYCGNWSSPQTIIQKILIRLLERIAGNRTVVLATGGAPYPPSPLNSEIKWIFATTLSTEELQHLRSPHHQPQPRSPRLIIVTRMEKNKGVETVIESLPILSQEFPNISLTAIGQGDHLTDFQDLARSLNIQERVRFVYRLDHQGVLSALQQADLFCFPTASEGFPKVVLEALACGLPVITTPVSVLPYLVGSECGVILDEVSPAALASAVTFCLSDPQLYQRMSNAAFNRTASYSLESWRDTIRASLELVWGPLKSHG